MQVWMILLESVTRNLRGIDWLSYWKYKTWKQKQDGFLCALIAPLAPSMLGCMLTGRGVDRT